MNFLAVRLPAPVQVFVGKFLDNFDLSEQVFNALACTQKLELMYMPTVCQTFALVLDSPFFLWESWSFCMQPNLYCHFGIMWRPKKSVGVLEKTWNSSEKLALNKRVSPHICTVYYLVEQNVKHCIFTFFKAG